ncbi:MAG TPA: hypothetical protein VKB34_19530 [Povalibacter sp.]|nr:hypothetical protein [Povalibacter sp.]
MEPSTFARRHPGLSALIALILATQLTACGGGDGDSGSTTPPPSSGGGDPPPPPPPPPPAKLKLTLKGAVTDEPIVNAAVTATIGTETFSATADANGNYSIDVEIDEANKSKFITLSAKGAGDQAFVEFTSLAGSFETLAAQAGADKTLSNDENFATQITNVSTAEAALLKEANGGEPVASDALLASLGAQINGQDVLDLATSIKLAVDDAANYPLPQGKTVLSLVSDPATRKEFMSSTFDQNPQAFTTAQTAIVQDTDLTRPVTAQSVPASLMAAMLSTDVGFTFNYSDRVSAFSFDANSTGVALGGSYYQPMTWAVDGTGIKVTYNAPIQTVSHDMETCNGTVRQVEAHYATVSSTVTLLSARTAVISDTSDVTYADCPSLEAHRVTTTNARTLLNDNDFQVIDVEELKGATQTIYVYDDSQHRVVADIADIKADGTGTTWALNKSFTWVVDDSKRLITATFTDGTVIKYRSLGDVDAATSDLFYEVTTADARYVDAGASVLADLESVANPQPENVPGRAYQFGIGNEVAPDPRLKGFRLRFDAGGTGAQEDDFIDDEGNLVITNERYSIWNAFHWELDGEDIVISRTFGNCVPGTNGCVVWDERRIVLLRGVDVTDDLQRLYWLEMRRTDSTNGISDATPASYLVRYYVVEDLPEAPVVGLGKPRLTGATDLFSRSRTARLRGLQLR